MKLVSIIIPAYNSARYIRETVESALNQTWQNREIIVVDDGSTDDTSSAVSSYPVTLIRKANGGASSARNVGLSAAKGDFIQWLDSDDLLAHDKIERQIAHAGDRVLLSGQWSRFITSKETAEFRPDSLWCDLEPTDWMYLKMRDNVWMPPAAFLVPRSLTDASGPWNEEMSLDDDGEYFGRVIDNSMFIRFVSDAKIYKREGMSTQLSALASLTPRKLESEAYSLFVFSDLLLKREDSPRTREVVCLLLKRWSHYFYPNRPDVIDRMRRKTESLGGEWQTPRLRPMYNWLRYLVGFSMAKKVQFNLPTWKRTLKARLGLAR